MIVGVPVIAWKAAGADRRPSGHAEGIGQAQLLRPVGEVGESALAVRIAIDSDQQFIQKTRREDVRLRDRDVIHARVGAAGSKAVGQPFGRGAEPASR